MTRDELHGLITTHLDRDGDAERWSEKPGAVLYSDLASIRRGRFYLIGINPGGHGGKPIRETVYAPDGTNSYADECWKRSPSPSEDFDPITGRLRPDQRDNMQKRICNLFDALGEPPHDVLSTNLAFARSPELAKLRANREWFHRCWPVHQALLQVVRPEWIIMLGYGYAYEFLRNRGAKVGEQERIAPDSRTAWHQRINLNIGEKSALETNILAVAHPSNRGFARAGLGGAICYPAELKVFIANTVLGRPTGSYA